MTGIGEMTKNEQRIGDIKNSNVTGVNVHGQKIYITNIDDILSIVEKHQKSTEKFQEQIDRLINIIEKKL